MIPNVIDIASSEKIYESLLSIRGASTDELEEIYQFLNKSVQDFNEAFTTLVAPQEYIVEPDELIKVLLDYHYLCTGLLALTVALHRKTKTKQYFEPSEDGKKVSAVDREWRSRGDTSDLEGLTVMLEGLQRNIQERVNVQRGKTGRSY